MIKKYSQTGITVKIHQSWRCQSDCNYAEVQHGWLIVAIFGHRGEASLRNYIGRPSSEQIRACSGILSDAFSGRLHHSKQPSFTTPSSRSIFIFLWFRLLLIHKTYALSSMFSIYHGKKLACFYEPQFGRISPNISLSDSVLETKLL